jgi:hypothetical protein
VVQSFSPSEEFEDTNRNVEFGLKIVKPKLIEKEELEPEDR